MSNPLVTIAIASYNNSKYINRCIDSVISQSYHFLEILIVDDGSTDNSVELCMPYLKDNRVKILQKTNGGLSSSRQLALSSATGDYICFIDADDYVLTRYVEDMLQVLERDKSDICLCGTKFIKSEEDVQLKGFPTVTSLKAIRYTITHLNKGTFPFEVYLSDSWNKMYRMSFLKEINVRFELPKGFNGTDSIFNLKVVVHNPIYSSISNENLVHILYKSSAVHRKNKRLLEGFLIIMEQLIMEIEKTNDIIMLKEFLAHLYTQFLKAGYLDCFAENEKQASVYKLMFAQFYDLHQEFLRNYPFVKPKFSHQKTMSSKLFVFLLDYFPRLLPFYFKVVKKLVK